MKNKTDWTPPGRKKTATDPIVTDPVVTDPVVTDPVVTDPVVAEPAPAPAPSPVHAEVTSHQIETGWGKVYVAVTNKGTDAVPLWETKLPVPAGLTINSVWGGQLMGVENGVATIRAAEWTLDLSPAETQTFGLSYTYSGTAPAQDAWTVASTASIEITPEVPEDPAAPAPEPAPAPVPETFKTAVTVTGHEVNPGWGKVQMAVSNQGDAVVPVWEAKVPVPPGAFINSLWGGQLVSVEDGVATIRAAHNTDNLAPGATQTLGLTYAYSGTAPAQDAWSVASTAPVAFGPAPVMATVNGVPTYRIEVGTNSADIQKVLDGAPAGAEVVFANGTHIITQTLKITRDDLTVRGESAEGVVLQGVYDKDAAGAVIQVEGALNWWPQHSLNSAVKAGDTSVTFSAPVAAQVGDLIYLRQPNTEEYLDSIGDTLWRKTGHSPLREVVVPVTAVEGNTVRLANSIDIDLSAADTQAFVVSAINGVTISDLTVDHKLGPITPGTYNNVFGSPFNLKPAVGVFGGHDVTVSNVALNNNLSLGLTLDTSAGVTVDGLSVKDAYNQGNDGNGYGLMFQQAFNNTVTDLSVEGMRHSILFASHDTEGNNTIHAKFLDRDINFHGGPDYGNTITVDRMEFDRSLKEVWNLGVWYNEDGWHGGAPTGVEPNDVRFREAITGKNHDLLFGHDDGSMLDGGLGNDTLHGGKGVDMLIGGMGDDFLYGKEGNDTLKAGAGRNVIEGGPGSDTFYIEGNSNGSTITDFTPGQDTLVLADGVTVVSQKKVNDTTQQITLSDGSVWDIQTTQAGDLFGMN